MSVSSFLIKTVYRRDAVAEAPWMGSRSVLIRKLETGTTAYLQINPFNMAEQSATSIYLGTG